VTTSESKSCTANEKEIFESCMNCFMHEILAHPEPNVCGSKSAVCTPPQRSMLAHCSHTIYLERITDFCSSPHLISAHQLLRLNSELITQRIDQCTAAVMPSLASLLHSLLLETQIQRVLSNALYPVPCSAPAVTALVVTTEAA